MESKIPKFRKHTTELTQGRFWKRFSKYKTWLTTLILQLQGQISLPRHRLRASGDPAKLTLNGSTEKEPQELLNSAQLCLQQQITLWPCFCLRNTTTDLQKIWSNGTCRIWPGALCWDLLETTKIPVLWQRLPEEMETIHDDFFAPFVLCRVAVPQKVFFAHFSCAGARTVSPHYIQEKLFSSLTDTSHDKISTATARHQKNWK